MCGATQNTYCCLPATTGAEATAIFNPVRPQKENPASAEMSAVLPDSRSTFLVKSLQIASLHVETRFTEDSEWKPCLPRSFTISLISSSSGTAPEKCVGTAAYSHLIKNGELYMSGSRIRSTSHSRHDTWICMLNCPHGILHAHQLVRRESKIQSLKMRLVPANKSGDIYVREIYRERGLKRELVVTCSYFFLLPNQSFSFPNGLGLSLIDVRPGH